MKIPFFSMKAGLWMAQGEPSYEEQTASRSLVHTLLYVAELIIHKGGADLYFILRWS